MTGDIFPNEKFHVPFCYFILVDFWYMHPRKTKRELYLDLVFCDSISYKWLHSEFLTAFSTFILAASSTC